MQADAAVWSVDLPRCRIRIRDCSAPVALLNSAGPVERRWLVRQLANVLAALPGAQDELTARSVPPGLPQIKELARQEAMLETVLHELARDYSVEGHT
jgi:hypothetical protein